MKNHSSADGNADSVNNNHDLGGGNPVEYILDFSSEILGNSMRLYEYEPESFYTEDRLTCQT